MSRKMMTFMRRFWGIAVSLGTLVGLYVAAEDAKVLWAFWLVVIAATLVAVITGFGERALDLLVRIRNYPRLLRRVAELEEQVDAVIAEESRVTRAANGIWRAGWDEGQAAAFGVVAATLAEPPVLVSIANWSGELALVGSINGSCPAVGARYVVQVELSGETKGHVKVAEVNEEKMTAFLTCVKLTVPKFWTHLAERVAYESSIPDGLILLPTVWGDLPDEPFNNMLIEAKEEPG